MKTVEIHTKLIRTPADITERVTLDLDDDEIIMGVQHHPPFFALLIVKEVSS